jgi:hypothetical protein
MMPAAVSGAGGHDATFAVACALVRGFDLSIAEARPLMEEYSARCVPPWSGRELEHKLHQAERSGRGGRGYLLGGTPRAAVDGAARCAEVREASLAGDGPRKARYDAEVLQGFAGDLANVVDLVWLANRSVVDPAEVSSAGFLRALYRPGERVIVLQNDRTQGYLWPDDGAEGVPTHGEARQDCGVWYLVQPVSGEWVGTGVVGEDGVEKRSRRSAGCVTAWRYLVLESDEAPVGWWLGALARLPLRVAAIYGSGGRSVHALVRVDARSKEEWDSMREVVSAGLVTIGADRGAMSAVRLSRLPQAWRGGSRGKTGYVRWKVPRMQKLYYLCPEPEAGALAGRLARRDVVRKWMGLASVRQGDSSPYSDVMTVAGCEYYAEESALCAETVAWRAGQGWEAGS